MRLASLARALTAAALVIVAGCVTPPAQAATTTAPAAAGAVVFYDDFTGASGASFDRSKWAEWSACTYNGSAAYGSIQCGTPERLDGKGHLIIPATPTTGASLRMVPTFQYGTFSARIKAPAASGYWPAVWTLNSRQDGVDDRPAVGEVDLLEDYTAWRNVYHSTSHSWDATGGGATNHDVDNRCGENIAGFDLTQWHTVSARIAPGAISYYLDGVQCGQTFTKSADKMWAWGPDNTAGNWLLLTLAVGGCGGCQAAPTTGARMLVDWVKVAAL